MSSQTACPRRCKFTLVAFTLLFSTVHFQMSPRVICPRRGIVTLVAFVWLHCVLSIVSKNGLSKKHSHIGCIYSIWWPCQSFSSGFLNLRPFSKCSRFSSIATVFCVASNWIKSMIDFWSIITIFIFHNWVQSLDQSEIFLQTPNFLRTISLTAHGNFQALNILRSWKIPGVGAVESPVNFQELEITRGGPLDISMWCKIKFLNVGRNRHIHIKHKFESHPGWQFTMFSWNHGKKCKKRCPGWLKSWLFEKYTTFKRPKLRNSFIISLCINVTNFFPQFPLTHLLLVSRKL